MRINSPSIIQVDRSKGHFVSLTLERHRFFEGGKKKRFLDIQSINTLISLTANAPHFIRSS